LLGRALCDKHPAIPGVGSGPDIDLLLQLRLRKVCQVLKSFPQLLDFNLVLNFNQTSSKRLESVLSAIIKQPYKNWHLWITIADGVGFDQYNPIKDYQQYDSRIRVVCGDCEKGLSDFPFIPVDSTSPYLAILPEDHTIPPDWLASWLCEIQGISIPFPLTNPASFSAQRLIKVIDSGWQPWQSEMAHQCQEANQRPHILLICCNSEEADSRAFLESLLRDWKTSRPFPIRLILKDQDSLRKTYEEICPDTLVLSDYPNVAERRCVLDRILFPLPRLVLSLSTADHDVLDELRPLSLPVINYLHEYALPANDLSSLSRTKAMVRCSDHYIGSSEAIEKIISSDCGIKESDTSIIKPFNVDGLQIKEDIRLTSGKKLINLLSFLSSSSSLIDAKWPSSYPLLSVIVPNYNHSRYLPERLNSILDQGIKNIEILLFDDASSDDSVDLLEKFAASDSRAKLFLNAVNSGSTFKQWKKSLALAKGRYVWIAESDDSAEPSLASALIRTLERNPNLALAYTQSRMIDEFGNCIGSPLEWTNDVSRTRWTRDYEADGLEEIRTALSIKNTIPNASAVVFRNFAGIEDLVDTGIRYCGDWLFWIRLCQRGGVAFSARQQNLWRQNTSNARNRPNGELEWAEGKSIIEEAARTLACSELETQGLVNSFREKCNPKLGISNGCS
jgi:Glycosyl transferase family 2